MPEDQDEQLYNLRPDFSEAQDFSPFPDTTLRCKLTALEGKRSKPSPGKDQIALVKWTWDILQDYEYTDGSGEKHNVKGRKLFRNTPAEGPGAGFLQQLCGWHGYDYKKFRLPDSRMELLGREVLITTELDHSMSPPINKPKSGRPAPKTV